MTLAVAILGLAILVLVHEAGHFFVARAVGMTPRKFYVGFPPALAKVRRKGIEYGIGAIPLGGYVKIPGMHRPAASDLDVHFGRAVEEHPSLGRRVERVRRLVGEGDFAAARAAVPDVEEGLAEAQLSRPARAAADRGLNELRDALGKDAYWRQRTWKKVAVIVAGPATNLVLAIALFTAILMQDAWQIGVRLNAQNETSSSTQIAGVVEDTPAARAGLQPGDVIVEVNGELVTTQRLLDVIAESEGRPLELTLLRRGEHTHVTVAAERREGLSLGTALARSFDITGRVTKQIALFFPRLLSGEGADEVASPVGIAQVSSEALEQGVDEFLFVVGLISLSLALLNLLPLLPLDGGHIAFSVIEGIRGRAIGRELYERVSIVGIAFVLVLFTIGLSNDIGG
jgi:regulator of sigma E protease